MLKCIEHDESINETNDPNEEKKSVSRVTAFALRKRRNNIKFAIDQLITRRIYCIRHTSFFFCFFKTFKRLQWAQLFFPSIFAIGRQQTRQQANGIQLIFSSFKMQVSISILFASNRTKVVAKVKEKQNTQKQLTNDHLYNTKERQLNYVCHKQPRKEKEKYRNSVLSRNLNSEHFMFHDKLTQLIENIWKSSTQVNLIVSK